MGTTTYSYDGDGRRVKKVAGSPSVMTIYVYDVMGRLVAEYNDSQQQPAGGTKYLTADHLGSTRVVTSQNQAVVARYDYLPFGEEIGAGVGSRTMPMGYGASDSTRQKFTAKERDSESGLDYFFARYYSSAQGRFTSLDPGNAGATRTDPQSWNGYVYARTNPLKYVDPDGLKFRICDNDGNCVDFSDDYINQTLRNKKINPDIRLKDNKIFRGDEQIGTYTRLSFDDINALGNGVINQLDRSANASFKMIGGFAVGTAVIGTGGGIAAYYVGPLGTMLVGSAPQVLEIGEAGVSVAEVEEAAAAGKVIANTITGYTKHGINSAISHDGVGVSARAILDAVKNPIKVILQSGGRVRIDGKDATVILNQVGKVITTWARSSAGTRVP